MEIRDAEQRTLSEQVFIFETFMNILQKNNIFFYKEQKIVGPKI